MDFQLCCLFALLVIGFRNVVSECHVDGQQYAADSRFILELYTCIRHHCKCFQDATWSCPASESERICDATSPPKTTIARNVPVPFGRGYLGPGFTLPPSRIPGNLLPQNFFPGRYVFPGHVRYGNVPGYNNPRNTGSGWWAQMAGHSSRSDYERKNVLYKAVQSRGYYHESGTGEQSGPVIVRQDSGPIIIHDKNDRGGVRNSRPGYPARKEHVLILPLEPVTEKPPGERTGYQTGADRRSGQNPGGRRQHAIRAGAQQPRQPSGQQPRQSGGQQPRQPSGQQPRQPSGQQPRQSGGQQPHQSGGQQPRQPGGQQPRQPVYRTDRRQSGGQQPRQPSGQQPRQSGGQQPRQPSGQQPRQPSGQQPRQPGGQQPRQSGGQQPRQPGGQQPRQPVYRTDRQQQSWDQQRRSERQRSGHATRPGDQRSRDGQNSGQSRHDSSRPIHAGRQGRTDYQPRRPNTQRRPDRTDPRVSRPDVNHQNRMSRPGVSPGNLPGERPAHRGSYPRSRGRHPTFMSGGPKQHITSETMHPNPSNANARKTVPRSCLVDGQNYALNSRFSLSRGCTRLVCYCRTDGTSSCPEDEMQDLCSDRDRNTGDGNQSGNQGSQDTKGATYCEADGLRYPVHANFTLRRDCNLLLCRCNSDGGYSCLVEPGQCADDVSDSSRSVEGSRPGRLGDRGELTVRAREPGQDSSPEMLYDILHRVTVSDYIKNDVITLQTEIGTDFYIIMTGAVSVYVNFNLTIERNDKSIYAATTRRNKRRVAQHSRENFGKYTSHLDAGMSFGELALITDSKRKSTVIADQPTTLLVFPQKLYSQTLLLLQEQTTRFLIMQKFIDNCKLFEDWHEKYKNVLQVTLREYRYNFGEMITNQGDPFTGLLFLVRGEADVIVYPNKHNKQYQPIIEKEEKRKMSLYKKQDDKPNILDQREFPNRHRPGKRPEVHKQNMQTDRGRVAVYGASADVYRDLDEVPILPHITPYVEIKRREGYVAAERTYYSREIQLCQIQAGEIIGDVELLTGLSTLLHSIRSAGRCVVYHLNTEIVKKVLMKKNPTSVTLLKTSALQKWRNRSSGKESNMSFIHGLVSRLESACHRHGDEQQDQSELIQSSSLPELQLEIQQLSRLANVNNYNNNNSMVINHLTEWYLEDKLPMLEPRTAQGVFLKELSLKRAHIRHETRLLHESMGMPFEAYPSWRRTLQMMTKQCQQVAEHCQVLTKRLKMTLNDYHKWKY